MVANPRLEVTVFIALQTKNAYIYLGIGVALSYGGGVLKLSIPAHRSKEGLCATNQQNK